MTSPVQTERLGVAAVAKILSAAGWFFREQPSPDEGIDAQVEGADSKGRPNGRLLGLQIKSGTSYFMRATDGGWRYPIKPGNLAYWRDYSLPVVIVLYDPSEDRAYWQVVRDEHLTPTGRGHSIFVPLGQELGPALALTGVTAMAIGNVAMVAVMTMTPVHMEDAGESLSAVGLVISLHVAGMFLPSPISGSLADRYGRLPVLAGGGATLIAAGVCSALAPGDHTPLVAVALVLLGIGWNLGLVGGSALITDAVAPELRPQSQGAADLVMGLSGALGSLAAGPLFHAGAFALLGAGAAALGLTLILVAARARAGVAAPAA